MRGIIMRAYALANMALIVLLSGCAPHLFQANFESDPANSPPVSRPPGLPSGDSVLVNGDVMVRNYSASYNMVTIANISGYNVPAAGSEGSFWAVSTPLTSSAYQRGKPVFFYWAGRSTRYGYTIVRAFSDHFETVAEFRIERGKLSVAGADQFTFAGEEGGGHIIVWQLNPATLRGTITVFHEGGPSNPTTPVTIEHSAPSADKLSPASVIGLNLSVFALPILPPKPFYAGAYDLDIMFISQREPEPADPDSRLRVPGDPPP